MAWKLTPVMSPFSNDSFVVTVVVSGGEDATDCNNFFNISLKARFARVARLQLSDVLHDKSCEVVPPWL